jgi:hypothetical protein
MIKDIYVYFSNHCQGHHLVKEGIVRENEIQKKAHRN